MQLIGLCGARSDFCQHVRSGSAKYLLPRRRRGVIDIEPERQNEPIHEQLLSDAAAQLRMALGSMSSVLSRIIPPEARDADPRLDAHAALLYQSYYKMLRIVNNMTAAAELASERPLPLRNDDFVSLCRAVCQCTEGLAQMQGISLRFESDKDEHIIAVNAGGVERLLLNLLSNAMKFTPRGGSILVRIQEAGEWVELTVADTGCGIPEELLPTLFDRYRHTGRMDPPVHGLGLGLPICHRIMAGHEGEIFAASAPGEGTAVTARFPNRRSIIAHLSDIQFQYHGGLNPTLLELCDAVPSEAFCVKYMD